MAGSRSSSSHSRDPMALPIYIVIRSRDIRNAEGFRQSRIARRSVLRRPRASRDSHPRQSGRRGWPVSRPVRADPEFRRTGGDRRAVPVGLYAGAEHGAERAHLRDAARDPGLSCRPFDRPARPDLCRARSLRTGARGLSVGGAELDSPPRRIDLAPAGVARPRTRGDLSFVPVGLVGWAKAPLGAVPTMIPGYARTVGTAQARL